MRRAIAVVTNLYVVVVYGMQTGVNKHPIVMYIAIHVPANLLDLSFVYTYISS